MVTTETLEGTINSALWYHYDAANDVLYLRVRSTRETPAVGEETDDGFILLRDEQTDQPVGLTIVNWWKRFGQGALPDSIAEIQRRIEPWAQKLAA
jgi:hypothetical protein